MRRLVCLLIGHHATDRCYPLACSRCGRTLHIRSFGSFQ